MMSQEKALGLVTLLLTDSQLSRNLDAVLAKPGQTPDGMWTYFMNSVGPFNISPADLTRSKVETLWLKGGVLQPRVDASPVTVGNAFTPPLMYSPGPCPNGTLQTNFMSNLP
jgi:hypothetical protein